MTITPVLAQYQTEYSKTDDVYDRLGSGMGYVLRTRDGRLIVIDGGNLNDGPGFAAFLKEISGEETPRIARWYITHPHGDHYGALLTISCTPKLLKQLQIDEICYSAPPRETVDVNGRSYASMIDDLDTIVRNVGAPHTVPKPGDVHDVDGIRTEVVTTWEDLSFINDPNDTSMVLMIYAEGQKILILGDAYGGAAKNAVRNYGEKLKCDFCQVAHHGLNGCSVELYEIADPAIFLLPTNEATMLSHKGEHAPSAWVFEHAKQLILMGDGPAVFPLPYPLD